MLRDILVPSRSTMAAGTFSGSPGASNCVKNSTISTGTIIIIMRYDVRDVSTRVSRRSDARNPALLDILLFF